MIQKVSIDPRQINDYSCATMQTEGPLNGFPLLSIDRDSYIVGLKIQSGINFDVEGGRHCIAIGKCCSLADSITFMVDLNHDYGSVCQGVLSCMQEVSSPCKTPRKGSIIIQNDVWVGHGATIMAGITLHNGCVIAANAIVTKDVPPYAIVGGNPAKILRYRFDEDTISGLQKIAWWDWNAQLQYQRKDDFILPAQEFVAKYLPEAMSRLCEMEMPPPRTAVHETKTVLLIPDFADPYPLYPKILEQYFATSRPGWALLIYMSEQDTTPGNLEIIDSILQHHADCDCDVILQTGETVDEHILFQYADHYITTRSQNTVYRTCLADLYQTKILYGTDEPLFHT